MTTHLGGYGPVLRPGLPLDATPRLASWNSKGHPDQVRLREYLHSAEGALAPHIASAKPPHALRLDVGLPTGTPLLHGHDLDNYLEPLAIHVSRRDDVDLVSVTGTKAHARVSSVAIDTAHSVKPETDAFRVKTTAPSQSPLYKEQILEQLHAQVTPLPDGPVRVEITFAVGPIRNWINLWKPTIDAFGPLLGSDSGKPWHPADDRITELILHRVIDEDLRYQVEIDVRSTFATTPAPDLGMAPSTG